MGKRKIPLFLLGIFLIVLGVLLFWFYQRSQSGTLEYQNALQIESEKATPDSATVDALNSSEVTPEIAVSPVLPDTSKESTDTAPGENKNEENSTPKSFSIKSNLVSFGYEAGSGRDINTIVLHSSHAVNGDPYDIENVMSLWKSYGVAPHYMIARDGTVYQLVTDKNIAYHAGDSKMPDGRSGVNNFSIGIEILNTKTDQYTSAQYQATKDLISFLKNKYGQMEVVGHDDIAPGRKTDPWNFDWNKIK